MSEPWRRRVTQGIIDMAWFLFRPGAGLNAERFKIDLTSVTATAVPGSVKESNKHGSVCGDR